jgi:hypothetical protein
MFKEQNQEGIESPLTKITEFENLHLFGFFSSLSVERIINKRTICLSETANRKINELKQNDSEGEFTPFQVSSVTVTFRGGGAGEGWTWLLLLGWRA